ncbi:MAG: C-GCAxxG-C-C family protein [Muribaculaceae bacterium]|nr:C-GCAxxG-C-C family protein [Muribaculaceae bacterium]
MMTLKERIERAETFRAQGYNCAQSVIMAFPDITGLSDEQALKLSIGLGGGCGAGELCGVVSAMALIRGMLSPGGPKDKGSVYADMKALHDDFIRRFGSCICRELKVPGRPVPCNDLIYTGIEMLHESLPKHPDCR